MHGELCIGDAVNWDASLNRGLVSWYLALPDQQRGVMFRDLAMRNHGTLTNGPTWQGATGRPGGWCSLGFDGTDDYVGVTPAGFPDINGAKTVSCWLYVDSGTDRRAVWSFVKDDTGTANAAVALYLDTEFGVRSVEVQKWGGAYVAQTFPGDYGLLDGWVHIIHTFDGSTPIIYLNGLARTFATAAGDTGTTGVFRIGSFNAAFPSPYLDQPLDDLRIYSRALSAADAWSLYQASRAGYPNELNWLRRNWYAVQDEGGGGNRRRRLIICGAA